VKALTRN